MNNINESVEIVMNMLHIRPTGYPILDIEREALQTLIDFVKRVESAEMPEKKEHEREFCGGHQSEAGCTCGALQFNEAIDVCKLFLAKMNKDKRVMDVEEIADIILKTNKRDYCRACEPCENPPCQRIKDLAQRIFDSFTPPEGKGISEEKVLDIVIKTIATGEKYTKEELVYRLKKVVKEIVKAEREGRL